MANAPLWGRPPDPGGSGRPPGQAPQDKRITLRIASGRLYNASPFRLTLP